MPEFTITEPISLSDAKLYLRVDDTAEDILIGHLITAAREFAERHENRLLVARSAEAVAGVDYFTISELEKAAMLMFLAHLYEHREAVSVGNTAIEMPLGATRLLDLYRSWPI